ncbi:MAG: hypothetical protein KDC67_12695 [Ignavibacteriae bacterium]|nr:hypothetical protein [Flavobacterium sp.]MCB0744758.1 hypothetical protein [Ignavibacteriota bacterium]
MKIEQFAINMITALKNERPCEISVSGGSYFFEIINSVTASEFNWKNKTYRDISKRPIQFSHENSGTEFRVFGVLISKNGERFEDVVLNLDSDFVGSVLFIRNN